MSDTDGIYFSFPLDAFLCTAQTTYARNTGEFGHTYILICYVASCVRLVLIYLESLATCWLEDLVAAPRNFLALSMRSFRQYRKET